MKRKALKPAAFIVAGTSSGAGKTTVTLGIMEALRKRGLAVQPFKAGPDYIDPGHHSLLLKRPSYNLDTWMMGVEGVRKTFNEKNAGADIGVIEGVMGLYDGKDGRSEEGSTAHLAKILGLPVLLVIDASKTARSAGAVIKGFEAYDHEVDLRWVIFNNVASPRHYKILTDSIPAGSGVKALGYMPKDKALQMPERHLGLVTSGDIEGGEWKAFVKKAASLIEAHVDLMPLLESERSSGRPCNIPVPAINKKKSNRIRIAVAYDKAFCFYYKENLEILGGLGAELAFFSPVKDKKLPVNINGIYIGGGYPEIYAKSIEANLPLRTEVKEAAKSGMPIYAECGGLMYLGRQIKDMEGKRFSSVGVFPWTSRMLKKRKALGYREIRAGEGCPFLRAGASVRGHEFHYSEISPAPKIKKVFRVKTDGGEIEEGYLYKSTLATYMHMHFASNPGFASGFADLCERFKNNKTGRGKR
ncbi:MAG: cobyrinate a,c-diamide synthase [Deltaproteobacteria bacterium]|nr:cobyrinate a,c-diamide synthase [Deltaproteobacteria bacterium]